MSLGLHVITISVGDLLQAYDEQTWLTILPHNMSISPKLHKHILQDSPGFLLFYCFPFIIRFICFRILSSSQRQNVWALTVINNE